MTTTYNLTTSGSSATIDGVLFQTVDLAPTGTGVFNSFLVIQNNPTEQGFNTDFSPLPLDDKQPSHTNALLLSSLQVVNVNGVDSYAFKLDANEPNSSSGIIDLTSLKIYSATTGNVATLGALGTPLYDMDAGGDVTVSLNAGSDAPAGSGKGDLFVYIPVSKFAGASPYVYLYSAFGGTAASNGGFEEWGATVGPNTPTPHATISGTKWIDADGNLGTTGDQTAGVGWTIFIDDNHNGTLDNGELSTTTDVNGSYTFTGLDAGTYDIREVVQAGWTQLGTNPNPSTVTVTIDGSASVDFYNFQKFSISGTKFEDLTGDGKSADDKAWSYAPVTIYIEDDGVAGFTAGDHRFTTTDASGNWKISGLTLADVGKKIYEVVPGGSEQTGTLVQTVDNPGGGGTDTGNDFTNFLNYSISGTKYEDLTGNGKTNDDTPWSHAPVTIYIEDDGVAGFTAGDHRFTTTDASGNWTISGLTLADVGKKIYEVVPSGSEQTGTLVQTVDNPGSGGTDTGNDFTNFLNYSISGTKYEDLTGNGKTNDDTPWSHAPVTIYIEDDGVAGFTAGDHRFTTTDASGNWSISGLTLADVGKKIYEVVPSGSEQTGTLVQTVDNPGSGGTDTGNDFTNFLNYAISGTKYEDLTGNGKTNDDTPWSHAPVTIYIEDDGVAGFTAGDHRFTTTDASGNWSISGLTLADVGKKIYEVVPSGSEQTGTLVQTVDNPGSGGTDTGNDFTNFLNYSISGTKYEDLTGNGKTNDDTPWSHAPVTIYIEDDGVAGFTAGDHRFTTTDASGNWSIGGLTLADVGKSIYEVVPGDSKQTGTLVQTVDNPGGGGTDAHNDFTNFVLFDISGTKYKDITGDGITNDDTGLAGIKIFIDLNNNGVLNWTDLNSNGKWDAGEGDRWTTTDANGHYSFTDLDYTYAGDKVYEVVPSGYVQTAGIGGYSIVGTSGHDQTTGMDFANFQFKPAAELTQGYWSNHTEAWDGKTGLGKTTSANDVPAEANPRTDGYLLLGDLNHNGQIDANEQGHTLLVELKAAQAIEAGATLGDSRTIMLAQAIATQLDINNGFNKYGTGNLEPHNLITEAVDWLKASGGVLADGTLSGQGTVSKAGVLSGGEWGTSGNQFYLGTGTKTWGGDQTINGVTGINGEDIKNALAWFNQGQLVVSQDGNAVAWNDNGTLENVHTNAMDNFWLTLHEQNLV